MDVKTTHTIISITLSQEEAEALAVILNNSVRLWDYSDVEAHQVETVSQELWDKLKDEGIQPDYDSYSVKKD